ncbi:MAG: hypothetical protein IPP85_17725 [Propionivibrio sp.]|nr:hypothetical protein [Propionivibrio sp.]
MELAKADQVTTTNTQPVERSPVGLHQFGNDSVQSESTARFTSQSTAWRWQDKDAASVFVTLDDGYSRSCGCGIRLLRWTSAAGVRGERWLSHDTSRLNLPKEFKAHLAGTLTCHRPHEVFRDFCEAAAISLSNSVDPHPLHAKREGRYLDVNQDLHCGKKPTGSRHCGR